LKPLNKTFKKDLNGEMTRAFKPEKEYTKDGPSFFVVVLLGPKPSSPVG
jgi:hypothetical protein